MNLDTRNPMLSTEWVSQVPFATFAQLRREPKPAQFVGADGRKYWALVRHADVVAASRKPELFSNEPNPFTVGGTDPDGPQIPLLISLDPPEHTQRRQLINKGFTRAGSAGSPIGSGRSSTSRSPASRRSRASIS